MEENLDSSNSTLTHCANSACKRKRECDSVGSNLDSRTPLSLKMYDKNHNELFQQLVYARLLQPPYDIYEGRWEDLHLWAKIVDVAYRHDGLSQPSVKRALNIVLKYGEKYTKDPQLQDMEDSSLKKNICLVFNPRTTDMGCLRVEFLRKERDRGKPRELAPVLPSMSSEQGRKLILAELGYTGLLSVQFGEDMDHLQISSADWVLFIPKYGPTSSMYISMASRDPARRIDMLRSLLAQLKKRKSY